MLTFIKVGVFGCTWKITQFLGPVPIVSKNKSAFDMLADKYVIAVIFQMWISTSCGKDMLWVTSVHSNSKVHWKLNMCKWLQASWHIFAQHIWWLIYLWYVNNSQLMDEALVLWHDYNKMLYVCWTTGAISSLNFTTRCINQNCTHKVLRTNDLFSGQINQPWHFWCLLVELK